MIKRATILLFPLLVGLLMGGCCKNCDKCLGCGEGLAESNLETANSVVENLVVKQGIKKKGTPVESSGSLDFSVVATRPFGLFEEGFDFLVTSENELAGLHLRVTRGDAVSESYLDIALSEQSSEFLVDTDFKEELGDGSNIGVLIGDICYEIMVFDTQGNVSTPKKICFDLIGWGQDFSIAGAWELQYYEERIEGEQVRRNVFETYCENGAEGPCQSLDRKFFSLSEDGSFALSTLRYEYENGTDDSNYDRYEEDFGGKWVYLENRLYLVVYENTLITNATAVKVIDAEPGGGTILELQDVMLDDAFQPSNMNLVVRLSDSNNDNKEEIRTEYYRRPLEE